MPSPAKHCWGLSHLRSSSHLERQPPAPVWSSKAALPDLPAVILSRVDSAPLAYIGGSLGTLIGADLTNLDKVRGLGALVASIGGAGTFDGIFLTGILAVLLASLYARPRAAHAG